MPNFTAEAWQSFKQAFFSVLQFLMYCFDLCFDTFRSNPLLYICFILPIFMLAFLAIFELFTHSAPFYPATITSKSVGVLRSFKGFGFSSRNQAVRSSNLAIPSVAKSEAKLQSVTGGVVPGNSIKQTTGKAIQLPSLSFVGQPSNLSSNKGTSGVTLAKDNIPSIDKFSSDSADLYSKAKDKFNKWNEPEIYKESSESSSSSNNYVYDYSIVSNKNGNLDIDGD